MTQATATGKNRLVVLSADRAGVQSERLTSIDMLRGFAMLLMALDHAACFARTGLQAESYNGIVPGLESLPHVLLGLLTNTATPIFFTLAGVSIAFFEHSRRKRGIGEWAITRFFLIRAGLLFFLELVVETFIYHTDPTFSFLSAVAVTLIALAFLRHIRLEIIALIALVIILVYPLAWPGLSTEVHPPGIVKLLFCSDVSDIPRVQVPILGWPVLALPGYVMGRLLRSKRISITTNVFWLALFGFGLWLLIRLGGGYGNFTPYQSNQNPIYFLIESKEPPSLAYLLFNLSYALVILGLIKAFENSLSRSLPGRGLTILGRTALFFYVVHLFIYDWIGSSIPVTSLNSAGLLRGVLEFLLGLVFLFPLCAIYAQLRQRYGFLHYL